ncbi:transcriptional regulator [Yersinia sp. Marseille-Q3913]|uniref:transcriptional regulator n=1 Tax=Yersinia sp. Marseille-Q3913 TaxID=2830769 RepID=UPI001BAF16F3|nr:transcriptional regulator [Yersinia sp. Marseille-Q3913]MBS0053955.1 winged helix-turn-helix domain-containing protein [Yersinia sp. Marseille-Q3913]
MKNCTYIVNNWSIDLNSGFITHRETQELKRLGEYQLKLITVLLEHVGEILSRDELTNLVWKRRVIGNNSLPNAIHTLRVALGDENKQQRIIQTIPKMGYLLDPTFCEIIEEITAEEVAEPAELFASSTAVTDPISPPKMDIIAPVPDTHQDASLAGQVPISGESAPTTEIAPSPPVANSSTPAVIPIVINKRHFLGWQNLIIALLLAAIVIVSFSYFSRNRQEGPLYSAIPQEQGIYSNINIFQLIDTNLSRQPDEKLNQRIKDTLYTLNKQLKDSDIHIDIYYYVSLRRLDLTFMTENKCVQNQLNMTIYHWRQDNQLLNNLIYREMERKINEMDNCQK